MAILFEAEIAFQQNELQPYKPAIYTTVNKRLFPGAGKQVAIYNA